MRHAVRVVLVSAVVVFTTACATADDPTDTPTSTPSDATEATGTPSPPGSSAESSATESPGGVQGTVVRFRDEDTTVDVTIGADNATTRAFVESLPLTIELEEFNGREKIAYLPAELPTSGVPGSDPEDGDLIYFTPWQNIGFYYNAAGIGQDDRVIHLGRYTATLDELTQLEGPQVRVELIG